MSAGASLVTTARASPEVVPMPSQSTCSIPACNGRYHARGWCMKHYMRWQRHGDPLVIPKSDAERFVAKVILQPSGCKLWTAQITPDGYGRFSVDGRKVYVHRWIYEHEIGPIPEGLELDHLCRNRACVEVSHLEPVAHRENTLRGVGPSAQNARKTHCPRRHEYTSENTYTSKAGGRRHCRMCLMAARTRAKAPSESEGS